MVEWRQAALLACVGFFTATGFAAAQDQQPVEQAAVESEVETLVVDNEVRALVAPIALYPDPLLAVILQASLFPIDIVQADRFIDDYQVDQTLQPPEDWDPAIYGLLNYPSVLGEMNDHLDWTQAMGDAVYDNLEDVQDSIQDLRLGAYSMGVLASNEAQDVIVEQQIVQIRPVSQDQIAIPDYDGFALLGALEPVDGAAAADLPNGISPLPDSGEAAEPAQPSEAGTAEFIEETEEVDTVEASGEADFAEADSAAGEAAYYDEQAGYAAPAAPAYAQPPVYAAPPPTVAYAEPASSFWGSTATFIGGAAVGGLLGYAIFDDDDNDNDGGNNRRNDINIEDSTIVVGDRDRNSFSRDDRDRVNAQLRDRRDRRDGGGRTERRQRDRSVAALPERRSASRQGNERRAVNLPQRDRERPAKVEHRQQKATAIKAPKAKRSGLADIKRPAQTKKDAKRGKKSRQKAANAKAKKSPQRQAKKSGGGKRKAIAPKGGKKKAKAQSKRGKKSRGKKRRG